MNLNDKIQNDLTIIQNEKTIKQDMDACIDEYINDLNFNNFTEDDKSATIYVDLEKDPIYEDYSEESTLNPALYSFVEENFRLIKNKKLPLTVQFHFPKTIAKKERLKIMKLFKVHYAILTKERKKENKRAIITSLFMVLIGAIILAIYFTISRLAVFEGNDIVKEILNIFAWVFIWEACDQLVFATSRNNIFSLAYKHFFNSTLKG
ncbi:MAG: hypothetical protein H6689_03530 [Erysipelotrichaceae bacterium]|nr:hypothetical protein [Erysipelotrichaceae bacterium]